MDGCGIDKQAIKVERGETYAGLTREERVSDRRERIVGAAVELFAVRDFDDVTVAEVCSRAKVAKRHFYDHFTDRAELLTTVHREQNEWLLAGIMAAAPRHPANAEELFRPVMETLVEMLHENPERARVIYINAPRMELRRRGVLRGDAEVFGRLARRVLGRQRDRLRFERVLLALVAGVSEVVIDWLYRGMADSPDLLVDHLTAFVTSALSALDLT